MLSQETITLIKKNFATLPIPLVEPLKSGRISTAIDNLKKTYNLSEKQVATLENNVFLVFLGIEPLSKLQFKLIKELNLTENIILDILDNLAVDIIKGDALLTLISIEKTLFPKNNILIKKESDIPTVIKPIEVEIAETEAALETIEPIRTMASDRHQVSPEETVHTSTQSAILN